MPRARLPVLAVLAVLAACAVGCATTATKDRARTLAREGISLQSQGRWAESRARLEEAQDLYDAPTHLLYLARAEAALGRPVTAAKLYRRLLGRELDGTSPPPWAAAQTYAAAELAALPPRFAWVRLEVQPANAPGLALDVDGEPLSTAWLSFDRPVDPGSHVLGVAAEGYPRTETTVKVVAGEHRPVIVLVRRDAARAARPAP